MQKRHLSGSFLITLFVVIFLSAVFPVKGVMAQEMDDNVLLTGAKRISDKDMDNMRAGFIDPSGMIYRFAVDVKTQIDGAITFVRSIVMMPDINGHLSATSNTQFGNSNMQNGVVANVINNGRGVSVSDSKGKTTVLNQTDSGALASIVLNSADNRLITQSMDINIVLQGVQTAMIHANGGALSSINGLMQGARMHNLGFGH